MCVCVCVRVRVRARARARARARVRVRVRVRVCKTEYIAPRRHRQDATHLDLAGNDGDVGLETHLTTQNNDVLRPRR